MRDGGLATTWWANNPQRLATAYLKRDTVQDGGQPFPGIGKTYILKFNRPDIIG